MQNMIVQHNMVKTDSEFLKRDHLNNVIAIPESTS